jgi:hypothetical protein
MAETRHGPYRVVGFQQLANVDAATGLTVPAGARLAYISAEAQVVRLRDDGTNPTAAIGLRIPIGVSPFLYLGDLAAAKFIGEAAGGKVNVTYLA